MRFPRRTKRADVPATVTHPGTDGADDRDAEERTADASLLVEASLPDTPPPPLTRDLAQSVRFNVAEPSGYFFPQVEEFVAQVQQTLSYWEDRDFAWQHLTHRLQTELGLQIRDVVTARQQVEIFKVQGSPLTNADGSFRTESQEQGQSSTAALHEEIADLTQQVTAVSADRDTWRTAAETANDQVQQWSLYSGQQGEQIANLQAWGDSLARLVESSGAADGERDASAATPAPRHGGPGGGDEAPHDDQPVETAGTAKVVAVEPQHPHAVADQALPAAAPSTAESQTAFTARGVAEADPDGQALLPEPPSGQRPLPVVPVDSELPEGATLPSDYREDEAAGTPSVRPGDPLASAHGVPLGAWAPELSHSER